MWTLALQRRFYRRRASVELRECWSAQLAVPPAYLAVDLEMSSLDANSGEIVSIGWVAVEQGRVKLSTAAHYFVASDDTVGDSATIHQIRDCDRAEGSELGTVLQAFLSVAAGRVLLFHAADLDLAFLNHAVRRCFGAPLLLPHRDTLVMERDSLQRGQGFIKPGELRLHACRERYHLPDYPAHNALTDALATAELFVAMSGGSS